MKRVAKWVGIIFALLILIVVSLPFLINVDQFRPTLQSDLSEALGREMTPHLFEISTSWVWRKVWRRSTISV